VKTETCTTLALRSIPAIAVAILVALSCGGCIVPVPHMRVHALGVTGQVVGAVDQRPLDGAVITSADKAPKTVRCDSDGNFRLPPRRGWHAVYFIGPICLSLLPSFDMPSPSREIIVSAPGYMTTSFDVGCLVRTNAYVKAGQLRLTPVEASLSK
jgi:hypothetical protein